MAEYIEQVKLRTNWATNPSAEGSGGWITNNPTAWTVTTDTEVFHSGSQSQRSELLVSTTGSVLSMYSVGSYESTGFPVDPSLWGKTVTASAFLMPHSSLAPMNGRVQIEYFVGGSWQTPAIGLWMDTPPGEWTEVWHTHTVPNNAVRARMHATNALKTGIATAGSVAWADDAALYVGAKDAFFYGDMPEYWGSSDDDHRLYVWDGTPNQSTTTEYHGGFWTGEDQYDFANSKIPPSEPPPVKRKFKDTFAVEISYGTYWVSLHDEINYKVAAGDFGTSSSVQRRRIQASSPFYDGTYLIHSTKENISESMGIWVYGQSQIEVSENLLRLEELFSQFRYQIRIRYGDHQETWICEPADFAVERSHVYMHNQMALMKFTIPRLPRSTVEVVM